jgi:hypothetical protein
VPLEILSLDVSTWGLGKAGLTKGLPVGFQWLNISAYSSYKASYASDALRCGVCYCVRYTSQALAWLSLTVN